MVHTQRSRNCAEWTLPSSIFLGTALSMVLSLAAISRTGRVVQLEKVTGGWRIGEIPATLPSHRTTVIHYTSGTVFAEVNRLEQDWPNTGGAKDAAIVLSLGAGPVIPSATFLKALDAIALKLQQQDVHLVICRVPERFRLLLRRTGQLNHLTDADIVTVTPKLNESLDRAYARAEGLRATTPAQPPSPAG